MAGLCEGSNEPSGSLKAIYNEDYTLVHVSLWSELYKGVKCGECGMDSAKAELTEPSGFAFKVIVKCYNCNTVLNEMYTSPKLDELMEVDSSISDSDVINIGVSYDGTWMKRGHTSKKGIIDNIPDVNKMKKAIYATLDHAMSLHSRCPSGEKSWCFFNRAIAKQEAVPKHDLKTMKTVLRPDVVAKIMPVYCRLASDELLSKCTAGKTQNVNETNISMRDLVSTVKLSPAAYKIGNRRDKRRLQQAATSTSENFKTSRKKLRLSKNVTESRKKQQEGSTYQAGGF
ncbi:hypothetical protein ANN_09186 [Periplaneta americana]|uniref:Uncharacterized protein n=1 Tax=Periplaneta americana TaxID=6978 RepID=A0ABQ8TN58_PERAM|nr:hypothetical protein ANN_09186 [Periplaneta americana]